MRSVCSYFLKLALIKIVAASCVLMSVLHASEEKFVFTIQAGSMGDIADVHISADPRLPTHNLGGMHEIGVFQDQGVALLRFDFELPPEAVIRLARLELFCVSTGFTEEEINREVTLSLHECKSTWIEGEGNNLSLNPKGASTRTSDGGKEWPGGSVLKNIGDKLASTKHQGREQKWYGWDLPTEVVKDWLTGKRPSAHGVVIVGSAPGKAISFASSQTTTVANRPRLILTVNFPGTKTKAQQIAAEARRELTRIPRTKAAEARFKKVRNRLSNGVGIAGDTVRVGDLEWTVVSSKVIGKVLKGDNPVRQDLQAGGRFVEVDVRIENKGKKPLTAMANPMIDDAGREFRSSVEAVWYVPNDKRLSLLKSLNPEVPFTCRLIYDVPENASGLSLILDDGELLRPLEGVIDMGLP